MSAAIPILLDLLKAHLGGAQTNPNYLSPSSVQQDEYGNPVDKQGNVVTDKDIGPSNTPMRVPGFWERAFDPEAANQETSINNQYKMAGNNANLDYDTKLGTEGRQFNALPSELQKQYGSPERLAAMHGFGSPIDYGTANTDAERQQFASKGGIPATVGNQLTSLATSTQDQQNSGDKLRRLAELGVPATEAGNEATQAGLLGKELSHQGQIQSSQFKLQDLGVGNDISLAQGLKSRIPSINQGALSTAQTDAAIADKQHALLPNTLDTMANNSVGENLQSHWTPVMSPFGEHINGNNVTLDKNPLGMNPEIAKYQSMMSGMTNGISGGSSTITGPGGRPINYPASKPSFTAPTGGTNSSLAEDETKPTSSSSTPTGSSEPIEHEDINKLVEDAKDEHKKNGASTKYHEILQQLQERHVALSPRNIDNVGLAGVASDAIKSKASDIANNIRSSTIPSTWHNFIHPPVDTNNVPDIGYQGLNWLRKTLLGQ